MKTIKPYRNELIQEIKEAGKELIDRADEFIPADLKFISNFSIRIEFPQGDIAPIPEITCEFGTFCTETQKRIF